MLNLGRTAILFGKRVVFNISQDMKNMLAFT